MPIPFDPVTASQEKARKLCGLRQEGSSVCDYAIRFRTSPAERGWNDAAVYDIFLKGLSMAIQDRLLPLDLLLDLHSLITLAIHTDNRIEHLDGPCTLELLQEKNFTSTGAESVRPHDQNG